MATWTKGNLGKYSLHGASGFVLGFLQGLVKYHSFHEKRFFNIPQLAFFVQQILGCKIYKYSRVCKSWFHCIVWQVQLQQINWFKNFSPKSMVLTPCCTLKSIFGSDAAFVSPGFCDHFVEDSDPLAFRFTPSKGGRFPDISISYSCYHFEGNSFWLPSLQQRFSLEHHK